MVGGYEIYKFLFPYTLHGAPLNVPSDGHTVTHEDHRVHEVGTMFELSKSFVQRILSNYSTTFLIYLFKMRRWIYMLIVFHKAGDRKSHGVRFEAVSAAPVLFWMKNNIREKIYWISQWYSGNNHFDVYQIKHHNKFREQSLFSRWGGWKILGGVKKIYVLELGRSKL